MMHLDIPDSVFLGRGFSMSIIVTGSEFDKRGRVIGESALQREFSSVDPLGASRG